MGYWDDGLSCPEYPLEQNISKAEEYGMTGFDKIVPGMKAFQCRVFDTTIVNRIAASGPAPESDFDSVIANLAGTNKLLDCKMMCQKFVFSASSHKFVICSYRSHAQIICTVMNYAAVLPQMRGQQQESRCKEFLEWS